VVSGVCSVSLAQNTPALRPAGVSGGRRSLDGDGGGRWITRRVWRRWEWRGVSNQAGNSAVVSGVNAVSLAQNTPALRPAGVSGGERGVDGDGGGRWISRLVGECWEWRGVSNPAGNSAVVPGVCSVSLAQNTPALRPAGVSGGERGVDGDGGGRWISRLVGECWT
jgi:hypothetical protein